MGTEQDTRPIFVSTLLSEEEREAYRALLLEYRDVFAWTYDEMPGLDPKVAIHRLAVDPAAKPVKQARRRLQPDLVEPVINEIKRLIEAEFIEESHYPEWLANIVVVKKKNGQREISVDFRNLNAACPKDFFPLTITEMIIDATISHEILSFMDGDGTE